MNNRIMIKLSVSDDCISLRTFSRGYQSPQRFILTEKELLELEEKGYLTVSDIRSFAKLALRKTAEQEKPESSGGDKGIAEETGKVHGRPFPEMERQQADHFV